MPLTDVAIKAAKCGTKTTRMFDAGGLYLELAPSGGRWWRLKYRFGGKEKRISLGTYPNTTLKAARERRDEARKLLGDGVDPGQQRKAEKVQAEIVQVHLSFEAVATSWIEHQSARWAADTRSAVLSSLEANAFPTLGPREISGLRARDVAATVRAIEERGAGETASRVLQRIRAIFRFAVVHELIEANPMLDLQAEELLKPRRVRHRAALPDSAVPDYLTALDSYEGDISTAKALRLLMLTAVRPGELRGARWAEIDFDAARWRIPADRMKMKAEHLVPLSRQAVQELRQMQTVSGDGDLVFPSPYYPGRPLSENTLNSALARMGFKGIATAHGFRALFSTVANECGHDADVIERQLAHVERNAVRAAYHRSNYLDQRTALLQWWADYLDDKRHGRVCQVK